MNLSISHHRALTALLALVAFAMPAKSFADSGKKFYIGAGAGLLGQKSTNSTCIGGVLGLRFASVGLGAFYDSASKSGATVTAIGAELDLWPAKGNALYLGPRIAQTKLSAGAISVSGITYGAGGGLNLPLGKTLSFGVDGAYLTGKISGYSAHYMTALALLKIWN